MSDKRVKLDMTFDEVLARLAQTPKSAIDRVDQRRQQPNVKPKAGRSPPRASGRKAT